MIDIRQMRYFIALAETLHFGKAAQRLNISQPPLSRQIAALEKDLGVKLINRHSRRAELTGAGEQFLKDASKVVAEFDRACRNVRLADEGELGTLSIGFMMYAAHSVLPALVRDYSSRYPAVKLELRELLPVGLFDALQRGQFDAAIMFDPGQARGIQSAVISKESLCLAVYPDHPLSRQGKVSAELLAGEPLIVAPAEVVPTLYQAVIDYCSTAGVEPQFRFETQLQQTIVSLVAEKLGIALVPRTMEKLRHPDVIFIELENAPEIELFLLSRSDNSNPALRRLLEMIA
nr:LysR substrate-binding domain-containing protein [uncultured Cohaesibacter sp.]